MNLSETTMILASKSPRRLELMKQAGYDFRVEVSNAKEYTTKSQPNEIAMELSAIKASNINSLHDSFENDTLIIGADTVVFFDGEIMGKPKDQLDAFRMISKLQNHTHQVFTGVTLIYHHLTDHGIDTTTHSFYEKTEVHVCAMTEDEISRYIATKDPFDKAGAYGIQGPFAVHIKAISGDYNNVVGLPISRLYHEINAL